MNDEEFNDLATRYLEDGLDQSGRDLLNHELLGSDDRIRQFNDLRMLAGLMLEHGRFKEDQSSVVSFGEERTARSKWDWKRWGAAAAILVSGLSAGWLVLKNRSNPAEPQIVLAPESTILMDVDFEDATVGSLKGIPEVPGRWGGDSIELVSAENSDVAPKTGKSMACLALASGSSSLPAEPESKRAKQWRILNLPEAAREKGETVAELCVQFNRDAEVPDPDLACRIELYSFKGSPETAASQLESGKYLGAAISHFETDSDPETWETAVAKLKLSPDSDFLLLGISGFGDRIPQPFGGERLAGHYVDGVQLILKNSDND